MNISNKNNLVRVLVILLLLIIIAVSFLLLQTFSSPSKTEKLTSEIRNEVSLFKDYIPSEEIERNLAILNRKSSSIQNQYSALREIFFYFDTAYFNLGSPRIRQFASTLDTYAYENLKSEYKKEDFYIACADEICGEKTPPELENIINEIRKLSVDDIWINSIILNLRTASHIPYDTDFDKLDKINSFSLAYGELLTLGNQEASKSAIKLKQYIKNKYNKNL